MADLNHETRIHPAAIIHPKAQLGKRVTVGAYSIIGEGVSIGDDTEIQEHVVIRSNTSVGKAVKISPFCALGTEPQHLKYKQEETLTEVGDHSVLREYVTIHRGTPAGGGKTTVGNHSYLMAYAHVAHDCHVGSHVIICNAVQLAGHVLIEDHANIGGLTGIVQFCRVGKFCYVGGGSLIRKDLPPYLSGKGNEFQVQGINSVGLTRQGAGQETLQKLKSLYKIFYMQNLTISQAIEKSMAELGQVPEVQHFVDFIQKSKMGFVR
ncbi:MAG: acyl-ACP--UDP-N-acetylglucosamine O-acyltransferase [Proteobacteria bacterium]|nr:acyl-ACP--UDP-N-acetylglucosamine O-acyltransferase [Pseudomonadota bacterium]NDC23920.1 acyl-ACP--UDP-N-acetylglucosamine O-acyltransferase [Pseudomonadota bacterium]NDD04600.1 acyl-ACP--UDP-N-acetylglucosamine O-acyltransferase [Pseudomonadota bacterium]NDG27144.1 acyl-ACP--UDP-N-acetylglucosamine O-acyltransferase [Pseudomonadota bacterium]